MASTDSVPFPRKNVAFRCYFTIVDSDGDPVTGAAGLDSEISKDGGAFADCTNEATEIGSTGFYYLELTATEMNADAVCIRVQTSTTGAKTRALVFYPMEDGDMRSDAVMISGDAAAANNAESFFDGTGYAGTNNVIPTVTNVTNAVSADVVSISGDSTAADNCEAFFDDTGFAASNSSIGSAGASALVSSTADSGTTSTFVDATLTEADIDYWAGAIVHFTSGSIDGQVRLITGFDPDTDTVTFWPATTQAVSTNTYRILPAAPVDIGQWRGEDPNALQSGRVDSYIGALAAGIIDVTAAPNLDAAVSGCATPTEVNAEVLDVLTVDTNAAITGVPGDTPTIVEMLRWLYALARHSRTINRTSRVEQLKTLDGTGVVASETFSDDGTTNTRGKWQ